MWKQKTALRIESSPFSVGGSWGLTQVVTLDDKYPYLLSHLSLYFSQS